MFTLQNLTKSKNSNREYVQIKHVLHVAGFFVLLANRLDYGP